MVKAPRMIPLTGHAKDGTPRDPGGTGQLFREPGKQNAHIARKKNRERRLAMAAKNDADTQAKTTAAKDTAKADAPAKADTPKAADEQPKVDTQSMVSERFIEGDNEKTVSVAKADPLTSSHFKDSKQPRFGVTVDEGPVVTVTEEAAAAIKTLRDAEKKEAELFKVYPDRD